MISRVAVRLCKWITKQNVIPEEVHEIYVYGFELIFSFLLSIFFVLGIGLCIRQFTCTLFFLVIFIVVRQYTGGFHARSYIKCQICTVLFYLSVIIASHFLPLESWFYIPLGAFGYVVIYFLGPIESPYKPLTAEEKRQHKRTGLILFETGILVGYLAAHWSVAISNTIFYTLIFVIILMILPKFMKGGDKHEKTNC